MVKIVEEGEDDRSESTSRRMSLDTCPSPRPSSYPQNHLQPGSGSPDSSSSISSAHTFHGFSAKPSPTHPHQSPFSTTLSSNPSPIKPSGAVTGEERTPPLSSLMANRFISVTKAALLLRFLEFAVCLVSFSVMTADRNRGWPLDSFDRYKEFRYSMSVNVIGFAYSGLQGCCLAHRSRKGKHITQSHFWCYIDFIVDQMLAYLLMSASSSAATRVDDWITNWGNDKFPTMAGASVAMSFIAFGAFALSSMISGYLLCTRRST